ncbi:MAG TPA: TAXI family TRAP transporter solute-binding subunit [Tepidisphaeraceae bacterium]
MRLAGPCLIVLAIAALAGGCAHERSNEDRPVTLALGTATAGGGFEVYARALAQTLQAIDPTLTLKLQPTEGSAQNVPLLESGRLDLALVQGATAHEALTRAGSGLRIIAAMYATPGLFVVRRDSPYRTVADLKGKRVVFGAAGSGLVVQARYTLDALGLDMRRDFDAVLLERAADGPGAVLDGSAAALWGGGLGWPGFAQVAAGPAGARFIGLGAEQVAQVHARYPILQPMSLPAGAYAGQDRPVPTVGTWSFILSRPGLPDDVANRLARDLHRGEGDLGRRLPQARDTTAANTLLAAPQADVIHPGVMRYLKQIGMVRER